jgi:hypothetical protein
MEHDISYHFTLVLSGVDVNTPGLEDALFEAGCDDALIFYRNNVVYLEFDKTGNSLQQVIICAIKAIESASIGAKVNHIEGSLATLSEIAQRTQFTKQAISLFIKGKRGLGHFPVPYANINSSSPLWRWIDVVQWLYKNHKLNDKKILIEAQIVDDINGALELRDATKWRKRQLLLNDLQ